MATIKSYTDLEQSKKLAEVLPLESADMCYRIVAYNPNDTHEYQPYCFSGTLKSDIPCWSLAALLSVIKSLVGYSLECYDTRNISITCELGDNPWHVESQIYDNEVDACYTMIIKLHEMNLL